MIVLWTIMVTEQHASEVKWYIKTVSSSVEHMVDSIESHYYSSVFRKLQVNNKYLTIANNYEKDASRNGQSIRKQDN